MKIGFSCSEDIGVMTVNPRAVTKLTIVRKRCPVCEAEVSDLAAHCREAGDDMHAVAEVLET